MTITSTPPPMHSNGDGSVIIGPISASMGPMDIASKKARLRTLYLSRDLAWGQQGVKDGIQSLLAGAEAIQKQVSGDNPILRYTPESKRLWNEISGNYSRGLQVFMNANPADAKIGADLIDGFREVRYAAALSSMRPTFAIDVAKAAKVELTQQQIKDMTLEGEYLTSDVVAALRKAASTARSAASIMSQENIVSPAVAARAIADASFSGH